MNMIEMAQQMMALARLPGKEEFPDPKRLPIRTDDLNRCAMIVRSL